MLVKAWPGVASSTCRAGIGPARVLVGAAASALAAEVGVLVTKVTMLKVGAAALVPVAVLV